MSVNWKNFGRRAWIGNWSPMVWITLALVIACTVGTVFVGLKLYAITGHPVQFNTK
jgi:hypothetical protein